MQQFRKLKTHKKILKYNMKITDWKYYLAAYRILNVQNNVIKLES